MTNFTISMALLFTCFAVSAGEIQWYSGAFPEDVSGKKTTSSNIIGKEGDTTKYVFGFSTSKSNIAFVQFLLKPQAGKNALRLIAKSKTGKVDAEVWIETKGWKFQGKIQIGSEKFSEIILPLKECKPNEVKYLRLAISNKNNPKRGMLFLKNPELCNTKIVKTRAWHTGVFKNKVKSSCEQSPVPNNAVKYSWKFAGVKAGPVSFSTKFNSKETCNWFAFDLKNLTDKPATLQIYIETEKGWKFQKKIKITSKEWQTKKFELLDADSTTTKYFRFIIAPKENAMTGQICIRGLKYIQ
jgi:hypothetical protein